MSNLRMKVKQGVAAFLAVCMMMPSFAGTAWADIDLDEEIRTEEHQLELNLAVLEQGIQEAVNKNQRWNVDKMKFSSGDDELITTYEQLFQDPDDTNPVYLVDYKFEDGVLPAKSDMMIFARTRPLERNLFEEKEESIEDWEKENGIETATPSDATPSDAEDENNGEDKVASNSEADGYQITGEEEVTILFKNSSNKNYLIRITLGGYQFKIMDVPSASILIDEVRMDTPVEAPAPVESAPVESVPAEVETSGEGGEVIETPEETQEALPEESSEEEPSTEETSLAEETPTEESATEETSAVVEETDATEAVTEVETEAVTEAETEAETEAVVSISAHRVPRVAVPVAGDIDPADLDEADPSYEEYIEEEGSMKEDLGEVYAPVLYRERATRSLRSAKQETTTASMVFSLRDVRAEGEANPFRVTMYDYFDTINSYTEKEFMFINEWIGSGTDQQNHSFKRNTKPTNITQGLVKSTFQEDDTSFIKFTKANIFPKEQGNISTNPWTSPMLVYNKATVAPDFFDYDSATGYYTFDSEAMGAKFDTASQVLGRGGEVGQFLPYGRDQYFNEPNLHFGMHLSFDFSVLSNGKVNGEDMVFEFRGDDDTWVYLKKKGTNTNQLAMDIGGIHGLMGGTMNFASGEIIYDNSYATTVEQSLATVIGSRYEDGIWKNYYKDDINDPLHIGENHHKAEEKNGKAYLYTENDAIEQYIAKNPGTTQEQAKKHVNETYYQFMGFERKDLAEYTLNFYILERGAGASNCYLRFNMPTHSENQVVVSKNVISSNPEDQNKEYTYELWAGKSMENLEKTETFSITPGKPWASKPYPKNYYFKVVEVNDGGAHEVKWKVGSGSAGMGRETDIFKMGDENAVLFTNTFAISSAVGKKALQQEGKPGQYDIELSVEGETVIEEIEGERKEHYLQNIVATDVLSEHVEFMKDDKGHPILTLSTKADGASVLHTTDGITYTVNGRLCAKVEGKTITWNVTIGSEVLKENETTKLSFPVRVLGETLQNYPNQGEANTGTHAGETGYYSNENTNSYVTVGNTASSEIVTYPFPKPVVRPMSFVSLILEKRVEGATTETKFPFTVTFENGGDNITASQDVAVSNQNSSFTVTGLGNRETVTFSGIKPGATYRITENDIEDIYYGFACTQIETWDIQNDMMENSVLSENPAEKTTTGSMNTGKKVIFTNRLTPKAMELRVIKNLKVVDMEETTFVFKVENQDNKSPGYGQVFYTSITVPKGTTEQSVTISEVPVSLHYQVTEEVHMRYEQTNVTNGGKIDVNNPSVTFTNEKQSDSYFSSTHVAVNKITGTAENFGFQKTYPGREPVEPRTSPKQLAAILPEDSQKRLDEEDSSDINKTV